MPHYLPVAIAALAVLTALAVAQTTQPSAPRIKLWETAPGIVPGRDADADPTKPTLDIYLPTQGSGAAILVLPGGGYTHLSTIREGSDIARMLNARRIAAFVLRYRHAPRYAYPIPILDAQRALRTVRARAWAYNVDPHRIGVLGFSAGGHLAAMLATQFDPGRPASGDPIERVSSRPDFAILLYPVITLTDEAIVHKGSRQALTGGRAELWPLLSPEQHVTRLTPPVLLFHGGTDRTVPAENSLLFYAACRKNDVPAELHIFQNGPHGFGLGLSDPELRVWPDLMEQWMARNQWLASN